MDQNNNNKPAQNQQSEVPAVFNFFDKEQFAVMQRVSMLFSKSELVPDMYKESDKNPAEKATANCMIAIEMAQRIGASPLMIMQNMVIIYGRPSWSSKFLVATVNTCGRFEPLKYRIKSLGMVGKVTITEYTKTWVDGKNGGKGYYKNESKQVEFDGTNVENLECVAYTCARGSDEVLESAPITIKLAIQEGWYNKAGSKWQTMTRQMLMYRAASFWTNAYAPELSMGMKTTEEVEDIQETIDIPFVDVTDKVNHEKKANANKETISMDDDDKADDGKQQPGENGAAAPESPKSDEKKPEASTTPAAGNGAEKTGENNLFEGQGVGGTRPGRTFMQGK